MTWNNVAPAQIDAMRAQLYREIPLGRLGKPETRPARSSGCCPMSQTTSPGSHLVCDGGIRPRVRSASDSARWTRVRLRGGA